MDMDRATRPETPHGVSHPAVTSLRNFAEPVEVGASSATFTKGIAGVCSSKRLQAPKAARPEVRLTGIARGLVRASGRGDGARGVGRGCRSSRATTLTRPMRRYCAGSGAAPGYPDLVDYWQNCALGSPAFGIARSTRAFRTDEASRRCGARKYIRASKARSCYDRDRSGVQYRIPERLWGSCTD